MDAAYLLQPKLRMTPQFAAWLTGFRQYERAPNRTVGRMMVAYVAANLILPLSSPDNHCLGDEL